MIKFFRNIRQNLLSEGKTGKYLKYAIGEIFLLVIGILIAIQLNELNKKSQETESSHRYIATLKSDIMKDTTQINRFERFRFRDSVQVADYIDRLSSSMVTWDTILYIARNNFNVFFLDLDEFNDQTISALLSTGDINIFPPTIRMSILKLKTEQATVKEIINTGKKLYHSKSYDYLDKYPPDGYINAIRGKYREELWNNIDKMELLRDMNALLSKRKIMFNTFSAATRKALNASNTTLELLEQEYPDIIPIEN